MANPIKRNSCERWQKSIYLGFDVHYAYPTGLTPKVIEAIRETPNVLPYLDLPLQHSHPDILRAMNRPWQGRVNDGIIERIKQAIPNGVLRTTFIVGFPGETEEHLSQLLEFVKRHEFDHVGVFTFFSRRRYSRF
jgi:ribosomal protein S12 methylthiotransferase